MHFCSMLGKLQQSARPPALLFGSATQNSRCGTATTFHSTWTPPLSPSLQDLETHHQSALLWSFGVELRGGGCIGPPFSYIARVSQCVSARTGRVFFVFSASPPLRQSSDISPVQQTNDFAEEAFR